MYLLPVELPGLLYGRIQAEVGIQLLRGRKQVKRAYFCDQDNRAYEAYAAQWEWFNIQDSVVT